MQNQIERDGCWRCDQWGFTLFFWNEKIGMYNNVNKLGVSPDTMLNLTDMIRMHCHDTYMDNPEAPVMFSNVTNWKPKPFIRLLDFLNDVEPREEPNYEQVALEDAMHEYNF